MGSDGVSRARLRGGAGFPKPVLAAAVGLAEVQRLKREPVMGINWIGSTGPRADYTKLLLVDPVRGQAGNPKLST